MTTGKTDDRARKGSLPLIASVHKHYTRFTCHRQYSGRTCISRWTKNSTSSLATNGIIACRPPHRVLNNTTWRQPLFRKIHTVNTQRRTGFRQDFDFTLNQKSNTLKIIAHHKAAVETEREVSSSDNTPPGHQP